MNDKTIIVIATAPFWIGDVLIAADEQIELDEKLGKQLIAEKRARQPEPTTNKKADK